MTLKKNSRLLFELANNARITTKELSRILSISQQSASYAVQNLFKQKLIQNYHTVVDPAKFGLVNIMVFYNYSRFEYQISLAIKRYLKNNPYITRVEEVSQGADLLVEYCVPNLSFFNKQNREFLYEFKDNITTKLVQVVIVRHLYSKEYLFKRGDPKEDIISGDRDVVTLTPNQQQVIKALIENPKEPLINIAKKTDLDPKTIAHIKKQLEKQRIIRRYSVVLNHQALGITRKYMFIRLEHEDKQDEARFLEYAKQHKNITAVTKIIGQHDILMTVEAYENEKPITNDLRKQFRLRDYAIMDCENIIKYEFIPPDILD